MAFIKELKAGSTIEYDPGKYDVSKPLVEKLLFSAPEYFVFETRFGGWLVSQLVKVLLSGLMSLINNHKEMSYDPAFLEKR